jgi:hypothetical protein
VKDYLSSAYAVLVTDRSGSYSVTAFRATYVYNGTNSAVISLAVGRNGNTGAIQNIDLIRGDKARLIIYNVDAPYVSGGPLTLFQGRIVDYGPGAASFGTFSIDVSMSGNLADLTSGTLQTDVLVPATYLDNKSYMLSCRYFQGTTPTIDQTGWMLSQNILLNGLLAELKRVFIDIAVNSTPPTDSVTLAIKEAFQVGPNQVAADAISAISGSGLFFRSDSDKWKGFIPAVTDKLNLELRNNWLGMSFFDRFAKIGEVLQFAVMETCRKSWCVPFIPYTRSQDCYPINADSYSSLDYIFDKNAIYKTFQGAVLTAASGTTGDGSGLNNAVINIYNRGVSGSTLGVGAVVGSQQSPLNGQVLVVPVPPFFCSFLNSAAIQQANNRGNTASAYFTSVPDSFGELYTKVACWDAQYSPRAIAITSPFLRTDVSPLTPVRVHLPGSLEIASALETSTIYGFVKSVTIVMDATQRRAATRIEIGNIRSSLQQQTIIDNALVPTHPLFTSNFRGARLDGTAER